MKIDIVVCDDNMESLENIEARILDFDRRYNQGIQLKTYYYEELLLLDINEGKVCPDILFLDIHMPHIDGVELAKKIRNGGYEGKIIFITVSDGHFLEAFDVRAFNYILKDEHVEKRLDKILEKSIMEVKHEKSAYIILSKAGEIRKVALDEIKYFEIIKRIMIVHYGEKTFEFYSAMGKVEDKLYGKGFVRVHKSYLVSMKYIESIRSKEIVLTDGEVIPIGKNYSASLRAAFGAYRQPVKIWSQDALSEDLDGAGGRKSG